MAAAGKDQLELEFMSVQQDEDDGVMHLNYGNNQQGEDDGNQSMGSTILKQSKVQTLINFHSS
jgi:hypothetical protein